MKLTPAYISFCCIAPHKIRGEDVVFNKPLKTLKSNIKEFWRVLLIFSIGLESHVEINFDGRNAN